MLKSHAYSHSFIKNHHISLYKIFFIIFVALTCFIYTSTHSKGFAIAQGARPELKDDSVFIEIDNNISLMAGQMILTGFRGLELSENPDVIEALKSGMLGSVILFYKHRNIEPYNIASPEQVTKLLQDIKHVSRFPLLIGIDQEGGKVQRISSKNGFKDWPSAEELGKGSTTDTFISAKDMGNTLATIGFNLNFAPTVDILDPNSPAIGKLNRSFHQTAMKIADHAQAFSKAMEECGIIPTLKHFPGHGSAKEDTHNGFTDVTNTWNDKEILPYKIMIDDGFSGMIMTAHVYNGHFDDKPASLSYIITTKLLRETLGFKGVVITDDMQMKAVSDHYSLKESVYLAFQSGSDILLFGNNLQYIPNLPQKVHGAIMELVKEGRVSEERIKQSWQRIRALKVQHLL